MTGGVNQLHIQFMPGHDRMLMRVATADRELRMWLTRRFTKILWPLFQEVLRTDPAVAGQMDAQTQEEVLSFQHQKAVQQTQFTKDYKAGPQVQTMNEAPILLVGAKYQVMGSDLVEFSLITARDRTLQLSLDRNTIHSLCKLISDCADKAEWGLELDLPEPGVPNPQPDGRTLN